MDDYRIQILKFAKNRLQDGVSYWDFIEFVNGRDGFPKMDGNLNTYAKIYVDTFDVDGKYSAWSNLHNEYLNTKKQVENDESGDEKLAIKLKDVKNNMNRNKYLMKSEAYFNLLEWAELKEARDSSTFAKWLGIGALIVSIGTGFASIYYSNQQLNTATKIDQKQVESIVSAIHRIPETPGANPKTKS